MSRSVVEHFLWFTMHNKKGVMSLNVLRADCHHDKKNVQCRNAGCNTQFDSELHRNHSR